MPEFNYDQNTWMAIVAGGLVLGFLLGWLVGVRGNKVRPLNRMAKSLASIAKSLKTDDTPS